MTIGGFVFDFPVWIIRGQVAERYGFACCEVEGQHCLTILTDEDLIQRYLEKHPLPGQITPVRFDKPTALAETLEEVHATKFATHIAIDPNGKAFVWPIAEAAEIMRMNG